MSLIMPDRVPRRLASLALALALFMLAGCDQRALEAIALTILAILAMIALFHAMLLLVLVVNLVMLLIRRPSQFWGWSAVTWGVVEAIIMFLVGVNSGSGSPVHVAGFLFGGALVFFGALNIKGARPPEVPAVEPVIEPPLPPAPPPAPPQAPPAPRPLAPPWP